MQGKSKGIVTLELFNCVEVCLVPLPFTQLQRMILVPLLSRLTIRMTWTLVTWIP